MQILKIIILLFSLSTIASANIVDTTSFRESNNYKNALDYYKNKTITKSSSYNYYQTACYYSLLEKHDSAFYNLTNAISLGAEGEDVLTDTDFNNLRTKTEEWHKIETAVKQQYLSRNPNITKPELGYELWLMWVEDQRWRTLSRNYKLKEEPKGLTMDSQYDRVKRLEQIIKESGWPKYSEVGVGGGDAVFYVFQHHHIKNMKKVLPLFIEAGKHGEADLGKVAMMIDRFLANTEGVQIYGSQSHREYRQGQNIKDIPIEIYPIADEENVRKRREALGMSDFDKNCERLGLKYVEIKDRSNYRSIPIKKGWIKKGYLLAK